MDFMLPPSLTIQFNRYQKEKSWGNHFTQPFFANADKLQSAIKSIKNYLPSSLFSHLEAELCLFLLFALLTPE